MNVSGFLLYRTPLFNDMKNFLTLLFLVFVPLVYGQNLTFFFGGQISNAETGKKEAGVTVTMVSNGTTVASTTTGSNGKYILKHLMPANSVFDLVFSKPGYVSKRVKFDFATIDMAGQKDGLTYDPVGALDLEIFTDKPNVDFSFLNSEPVASFKYNQAEMAVRNDAALSQRVRQKIEGLLEKAAEADNVQKKYEEVIKRADGLYAQKKYKEALTDYEQAAGMKPKEIHPQNRIKEIDGYLKAQEKEALAQEQKDKEYQNLITAGDNLRDQKKYGDAIAKYQEALKIKNEVYPRDQIAQIEKKQNDEKLAAGVEKSYNEAISAADAAFQSKDYVAAKQQYEKALSIKKLEKYPKDQLAKIAEIELAAKQNALEDQKYKQLVLEADNLFKTTKLEEAKDKYLAAQKIKPSDAHVSDRLKQIDDQLAKRASNNAKEQKINALFQEGQQAIDAKNYDLAKKKYQEILTLDGSKNLAQVKLNEIDRLVNADQRKQTEAADYAKYVAASNTAIQSKNWEEAKKNLLLALAIKEDPVLRQKYDQVMAEMVANQANQLVQDKYKKLVEEGDQLFGQNKWQEARIKYVEASKIDDTQAKPKQKIAQIDQLLGGEKELDEKYRAEMKKGDQLMAEEKYLLAIQAFNAALTIKPNESEPKVKAAEAERLEKLKNNEADNQFEKIIATAESKIDAKEFDRAIELLNRAKGFRPNDKRPDQLLAKVERLKQGEKQYQDKMKAAAQAETNQKYSEALALYQDANRIKPEESKPIEKINEMKQRIGESNALALQESQYKDYFSRGVAAMKVGKYENALESFKMALSVKPNDVPAQDKIKEINQVLDDLQKSQEKESQTLAKFNELVKKADVSYRSREYEEALKTYQAADKVIPNDKYVVRQMEECQRMLVLAKNSDQNKRFNELVTQGDQAFESTDWSVAQKAFKDALVIKPSATYPQKRLAEIEAILHPSIVQNDSLQPLGEKFEGDEALALQKADLQRRNAQNNSVEDIERRVIQQKDSLAQTNRQQGYAIKDGIYSVESTVIQRNQEAQQDLSAKSQQINQTTKALQENEERLNEGDRASSEKVKSNIEQVVTGQEDYQQAQKNRLQAENYELRNTAADIAYKEFEKEERLQNSLQVKGEQLTRDVTNIENKNAAIENYVRENAEKLEAQKDMVIVIDNLNGQLNQNQSQITQNEINQSQLKVDLKNQSDAQMAVEHGVQLEDVNNAIQTNEEALKAERAVDGELLNAHVKNLEQSVLVDNQLKDQNRQEGVLQLQMTQTVLEREAQSDLIQQSQKRQTMKDGIGQQESNIYLTNQQQKKELEGNYMEMEAVKGQVNDNQSYQSTKNDLLSKKTTVGIDMVEQKVIESNATTTERQNENQKVINQTVSSAAANSNYLSESTEKKIQDQKAAVERSVGTQNNKTASDNQVARDNYTDVDNIVERKDNFDTQLKQSNDFQQKSTYTAVRSTEKEVIENNATTNDKLFENSRIMATEQAYQSDNESRLAEKNVRDKQNVKAKIDNVDTSPQQTTSQNTLGQQYPEGVTEEKFSQNDDKGILKTIITRRIVVIEGHADVYLKTQSANNITYSKNGNPITEYTWQRETQNGKLKRN